MADLDERIGRVFRGLSTEHAETRSVDADALFARIQSRLRSPGAASGTSDRPPLALVPTLGSDRARAPARLKALGARRAAALGTGLAAAALAVAVFWPGSETLAYEVVGPVASSTTGEGELLATEAGPAEIRFSDESVVELGPSTTIRLQTLSSDSGGPEKVTSRVSHGRLSVEVKHREGTDYRFFAGRYEVRVVGTSFDLSYEPGEERLDLAMRSGRVEVLDGSGKVRVVSAGERMVLPPVAEPRETPNSAGASGSGDASSGAAHTALPSDTRVPGAPNSEQADAGGRMPSGAGHAPGGPGVSGPGRTGAGEFRALAAEGRFAEIVRLASAEGIDRALATRSAADLQELAHAARYTGKSALAGRAWKVLTERFASDPAGKNARFFLARLDEDEGRKKEALRGYDAYLGGGGVYSTEALGRRLLLTRDVHGPEAARPLAKEYLAKLPRGAYARTARELLESE